MEDMQALLVEEESRLVRVSQHGRRGGHKDNAPRESLRLLLINKSFQFNTKEISVDQRSTKLE